MKKIITKKELELKMQEAINLLCDTVKVTLGPKGNNVIIDHSTFSPFITNDGVTIALNIESDDAVINTILELAKEASIKTNELVGDGTTTTLVLLQSIFNAGLNLVQNDINPIILKKELNEKLNEIKEMIYNYSKVPSKEELLDIAIVSSNDQIIGKNINDAYTYGYNKNAITIKEWDEDYTSINYLKGYIMESNLASIYFLNNQKQIDLTDSYILIINNDIMDINILADIINEIIIKHSNLVIIANNYSEEFINDIININIENNLQIILLKSIEYGLKKLAIFKDLYAISNAKIVDDISKVSLDDLGIVKNIIIDNESVKINFKFNNLIKDRLLELDEELNNPIYEKEFIEKRIAMFKNGTAEILVGAHTITERRELKMRYDDALWAIDTAKKGIVPGSGIVFYQISNLLTDETNASKILKSALKKPLEQILDNAGLDTQNIINNIIKSNYNKIYNVIKDKYEQILDSKIVDPTLVLINSLSSAISIASMLLTTSSIVINEYENNLNKINDYNEL